MRSDGKTAHGNRPDVFGNLPGCDYSSVRASGFPRPNRLPQRSDEDTAQPDRHPRCAPCKSKSHRGRHAHAERGRSDSFCRLGAFTFPAINASKSKSADAPLFWPVRRCKRLKSNVPDSRSQWGRFIGDDRRVRLDAGSGESHTLSFLLKHVGQGSAVTLAQGDDATAFCPSMGAEPPIDAVRTGVGRADMATEIGAVDLDCRIEHDLPSLEGKRFTHFVGKNKSCLVGDVNAARKLQRRHSLGGIGKQRDRT